MGEEDCSKELQLFTKPFSSSHPQWPSITPLQRRNSPNHLSLDLNLSIGVGSFGKPSDEVATKDLKGTQALQLDTAEQIRLATLEKAYAKQVKELTRREMEMAEQEFARARLLWERAKEEVEKVERMKETAIQKVNSTCAEITCRACQQRFRP